MINMFSKKNLQDIPVEGTSHNSGSRKMIVAKDETSSKYFEAHTYGYLPAGVKWEMHMHENIIEICVVTKGKGTIKDADGNVETFSTGDRFIFPANTKHEIENNSDSIAEFYFIRFQNH
jgi:quercetin dioxygenase-like cupin family protein